MIILLYQAFEMMPTSLQNFISIYYNEILKPHINLKVRKCGILYMNLGSLSIFILLLIFKLELLVNILFVIEEDYFIN